jgi:hypothetical protein
MRSQLQRSSSARVRASRPRPLAGKPMSDPRDSRSGAMADYANFFPPRGFQPGPAPKRDDMELRVGGPWGPWPGALGPKPRPACCEARPASKRWGSCQETRAVHAFAGCLRTGGSPTCASRDRRRTAHSMAGTAADRTRFGRRIVGERRERRPGSRCRFGAGSAAQSVAHGSTPCTRNPCYSWIRHADAGPVYGLLISGSQVRLLRGPF